MTTLYPLRMHVGVIIAFQSVTEIHFSYIIDIDKTLLLNYRCLMLAILSNVQVR